MPHVFESSLAKERSVQLDRRQFTTTLAAMGVGLLRCSQGWAASDSNASAAQMKAILERHIAKGYAPGMVAMFTQTMFESPETPAVHVELQRSTFA